VIRTLLILILLVAVFALVFAPAALLRQALPADGNVALTGLAGTLWNGRADLTLGGRAAGSIAWHLTPVTFLRGRLGYALEVTGPQHEFRGNLALAPAHIEVVLDGTAPGSYFNAWLGAYDIALAGEFALESLRLALPYRFEPDAEPVAADGTAAGRLTWSGGPVRYRLSAQDHAGVLPPLEARLGAGPTAEVQAQGSPIPLLHLELLANGFVRIGMTRLMAKMLNTPWPGAGADHEVVLEVEERLL